MVGKEKVVMSLEIKGENFRMEVGVSFRMEVGQNQMLLETR